MRNGSLVTVAKNKASFLIEKVKILWEAGRYDGPLSGILEYNGDKCFFEMKRDYGGRLSFKVGRTYNIYKLTPEQWDIISYWHKEFNLHVGTHCNYEYSEQAKFYERCGTVEGTFDYYQEMFFERQKQYIEEHGDVHKAIDRKTQIVGWCTWDVLIGKPFKEWRRSKLPREKLK